MKDFASSAGHAAALPPPGLRAPSAPRPESPRRPAPMLRWSWKLARIAGVDIHVHATFLLLIAFLAFSDLGAGHGAAVAVRGTLLTLAVFTTVVLHELGHALMARRFGVHTRDILLLPIGGVARLEKMPDRPGQQLLVSLAGPAVNLAIALVLFALVRLIGAPSGLGSLFLTQLMWISVSLAVFNLLPGYPMDGGRILRALLALRMAPERATQTAARVGQGVAVMFGVAGLFVSPLLMVIAVFVWLGAKAEHAGSTVRTALAGLSVRDGMITEFRTVAPTEPLSRAVQLTLAGFQQDFPVLEGPRLVGVLTHGDVLKGLASAGPNLPVRAAMGEALETVSPSEALEAALTRLHQGECRAMVVVEDDRVVGLLTVGNIGELLAVEAAAGQTGAGRAPPSRAPRGTTPPRDEDALARWEAEGGWTPRPHGMAR